MSTFDESKSQADLSLKATKTQLEQLYKFGAMSRVDRELLRESIKYIESVISKVKRIKLS